MKKLTILFFIFFVALFLPRVVFASSPEELQAKIQQYETKISELKQEETSLSKQISIFNSNIELSKLRIETVGLAIDKLETEINELAGEIEKLEVLLTKRLELMLHRIPETYKRQQTSNFGVLFFSSNVSDFISRLKYMNRIQEENSQLLVQLKATQNNFGERKETREKKKVQQENLKKEQENEKKKLDQQKMAKQKLLEQTKNSETTYQTMLSYARNELLAIQTILAGGGEEAEVRAVNKGNTIANVIIGDSCNSSGTHLHFMITKSLGSGYTPHNPFTYLTNVAFKNCSGSYCGSSDQDSFNPSGSWNWPLDPEITLTQGYGYTSAIKNGSVPYDFHDGIDIQGANLSVKAVQDGVLFRGFYHGFYKLKPCNLPYVRVKHKDSDISTFYLHVYSN